VNMYRFYNICAEYELVVAMAPVAHAWLQDRKFKRRMSDLH